MKICPEQVNIPPRGCVLVQPRRACCPYLSCKTYRLNSLENELQLRRFDEVGPGTYDISHPNAFHRSDDISLFEEDRGMLDHA